MKTINFREEYRNLTIRNSFMFSAVFSDHRLMAELLARILPHEHLDPDAIIIREKDVKQFIQARGVRYDVYHREGTHLFDVELQIEQDRFLFDRALYNASTMILSQVHPGDSYELPFKTYVIFICAFDVNHGERMKHYMLRDEGCKHSFDKMNIIMIGCASKENDNEQLKSFTDYIMDPAKIADDPFIRDIEHSVEWKRRDPESERSYMDLMYEKYKERMKGFREAKTNVIQTMYKNITADDITHDNAVRMISKLLEINPEDIEQMLAEEPGEEDG